MKIPKLISDLIITIFDKKRTISNDSTVNYYYLRSNRGRGNKKKTRPVHRIFHENERSKGNWKHLLITTQQQQQQRMDGICEEESAWIFQL